MEHDVVRTSESGLVGDLFAQDGRKDLAQSRRGARHL